MQDRTEAAHVMRRLSLEALRGFESAARHGSFTDAAAELGLTQSAVSKQVRSIEDAVGRPLFVRAARGLQLTPAGTGLAQGVRSALERLSGAIGHLNVAPRPVLRLTTWPSFASLWLTPQLESFVREHPDTEITVDGSPVMEPLDQGRFDLAVRLTRTPVSDRHHRWLGTEQVVLVAAPEVARRVRAPRDLRGETLLASCDPNGRHPWLSWPFWFDRLGLPQAPGLRTIWFTRHEMAIRAALEGTGVTIARTPALLRALLRGDLEAVLPSQHASGLHYGLVTPPARPADAAVEALSAWLIDQIRADTRRWHERIGGPRA